MDKERNVDISEFGYTEPVVVKRLTAGEKRDLNNALTKANRITMKGQDVVGDLMPGDTDLIAAKFYFKSGPFKIEDLPSLDWELVAMIAMAGDDLNSPFAGQRARSASLGSDSP